MTDVHFQPRNEFGTMGTSALDSSQVARTTVLDSRATLDQTEMAAFEKGRMQGEMEAIRRMEADAQNNAVLKQFPAEPVALVNTPDVVEINRLTWLQRAAAVLGELGTVAYVVLTGIYFNEYRGGYDWTMYQANDSNGNIGMWNAHFLAMALGLFFLTQAILLYRVLPLNLNPNVNRALYIFNQCAFITCMVIAIIARERSQNGAESTWWGVDSWCLALALFVAMTHSVYSIFRVLGEMVRPVTYETWAETNNHVTHGPNITGSPEQRRDQSKQHDGLRSVYAPAPHFVHNRNAIPAASSNMGAQVPVAPGNAPRWAENPNTHAENYFLLPRAKWAVVGFFATGCALLMTLSAYEHIIATRQNNWSQDVPSPTDDVRINEDGQHAWYIGALGLTFLASFMMIAYAAMPPRTTLVKNGILHDQTRRTSISHTADTRLGHNVV